MRDNKIHLPFGFLCYTVSSLFPQLIVGLGQRVEATGLPVSSVTSKLSHRSPLTIPDFSSLGGISIVCQVKFEKSTHQPIFHNLSHKDSMKDFLRYLSVLKTCLVWAISFFNSGNQHYYSLVGRLVIVSDFLSCLKYLVKKT